MAEDELASRRQTIDRIDGEILRLVSDRAAQAAPSRAPWTA